jgi:hypothetical protein
LRKSSRAFLLLLLLLLILLLLLLLLLLANVFVNQGRYVAVRTTFALADRD